MFDHAYELPLRILRHGSRKLGWQTELTDAGSSPRASSDRERKYTPEPHVILQPPVTERKDLPRATSLAVASGDREERSTPEPQVSLQPPVTERKDLPRATSIDAASSDQEERFTQSHKSRCSLQ
ncbi:hypothetical protein J6590_061066 [Homalodisca vitripennis]|nr:hypothetical protein J6590_061066 [Homalodisca vitripennis]